MNLNRSFFSSFFLDCLESLEVSTDQVVPDADMTASSQYDSTTAPSGGRLNYQTQYDDQGVTVTQIGGWAAAKLDQTQWLQVKFSQVFQITAVATQGQEDAANWVTSYKLQYSIDGAGFTDYSKVRHLFTPFSTSTIRCLAHNQHESKLSDCFYSQ